MSFNPGINDNQNFRIQNGRPSSRVLAPAGGGQSSLSFGIAPPKKKPIDKEPEVLVEVVEQKVQQADTAKFCGTTNLAASRNNVDQPVSANAFARGSNMNGAQVMTGHPTTRVLAPAGGGETSIKLG